jgi:hypothetical protein
MLVPAAFCRLCGARVPCDEEGGDSFELSATDLVGYPNCRRGAHLCVWRLDPLCVGRLDPAGGTPGHEAAIAAHVDAFRP